jgi:hypothetical protein
MRKKRKENEDTDAGLTTAILAGASARPEVRSVPTPSLGAGGGSSAGAATPLALDKQVVPLLSAQEGKELHSRWDAIQVSFVDEPREAVEQADSLVAAAMKRLAEMFAAERARLDGQWDRGDNVSTENLRLALQRYRSFFGRLLSV